MSEKSNNKQSLLRYLSTKISDRKCRRICSAESMSCSELSWERRQKERLIGWWKQSTATTHSYEATDATKSDDSRRDVGIRHRKIHWERRCKSSSAIQSDSFKKVLFYSLSTPVYLLPKILPSLLSLTERPTRTMLHNKFTRKLASFIEFLNVETTAGITHSQERLALKHLLNNSRLSEPTQHRCFSLDQRDSSPKCQHSA